MPENKNMIYGGQISTHTLIIMRMTLKQGQFQMINVQCCWLIHGIGTLSIKRKDYHDHLTAEVLSCCLFKTRTGLLRKRQNKKFVLICKRGHGNKCYFRCLAGSNRKQNSV